jgi:hypothetical protein
MSFIDSTNTNVTVQWLFLDTWYRFLFVRF